MSEPSMTSDDSSGSLNSSTKTKRLLLTAMVTVLAILAVGAVVKATGGIGALRLGTAISCPSNDSAGVVSPSPSPGVNWSGCNLIGADLAGFDLTGANLSNATLYLTKLDKTVLTDGNLYGVKNPRIEGTPAALPSGWLITQNYNYLVGPGADLTGVSFYRDDLTSADLTNANLTNANLGQTTLTDATMTGATMTGVRSSGIAGAPKSLPSSNWTLFNGCLVGPGANTSDCSNLSNIDLTNKDVSNIKFSNTNLSNATLNGTKLTGATLTSSDLTGADLTAAILTGAYSAGLRGTPRILPNENWTLFNGYLVGPGINVGLSSPGLSAPDLTNINLTNKDITGADLRNVTLTGANLQGATLTRVYLSNVKSGGIRGVPAALPSGWKIVKAYLIGDGANLSDADLTGADLTGATMTTTNLDRSILTNTILTNANLSNSKMFGMRSGGITGTQPALPGYKLINGYLVGPGSDLTGADFTGADLTDVVLSIATLTGADLTGATMTRVKYNSTICPNGTNSNARSPQSCAGQGGGL